MRRRSKAGSKPTESRDGRSMVRPKARKAPTAHLATADLEEQLVRLRRERDEALEQLEATSGVLHVISSSPAELQSVLDMVGENAARLCDANNAVIFRLEGDRLRQVASYGGVPTTSHPKEGLPVNRGRVTSRAVCERRTIHVNDLAAETDEYPEGSSEARRDGHRTTLATPLLREGEPIGAILIRRMDVRPFSHKQIKLLTNFAAQAVIAIENARLLNELRESLQQQTATSEVLQVISSSPGKLALVFNAMLENAVRICGAKFGNLFLLEGDNYRVVAVQGEARHAEYYRTNPLVEAKDNAGVPLDRVRRSRHVLHISDIREDVSYLEGNKRVVALVDNAGARTYLAVPLLKNNEFIGAVAIYRQDVQPFSEKQVELVQNFAAQAVIAIENARLLNELRERTDDLTESLEQQTATSKVLDVISRSPSDLAPVFNTMLANAVRICEAKFGILYQCEGDALRTVAMHGVLPSLAEERRQNPILRPPPGTALGRSLATKHPVQIADVLNEPHYFDAPSGFTLTVITKLGGARTILAVPMFKDTQPGEFTEFRIVLPRHAGTLGEGGAPA